MPLGKTIIQKIILLFFGWIFLLQLDCCRSQRSREDNFHLPFRYICISAHAFRFVQCPNYISEVYDGNFFDMVEKCLEVFMDDFSVFGPSFDVCLSNLERVLQRCEESNLVLNWEKCHFMVQEGIVLRHKISVRGTEVDRAKIDVIEKIPPPMNVKGVRSFLGHVGFYRRFIKDFSKVAKPLSHLLNKDVAFVFNEECMEAF